MSAYLPYEKSKPCLSLEFAIQDLRHLMFSRNFLLKSLKVLVSSNHRRHFLKLKNPSQIIKIQLNNKQKAASIEKCKDILEVGELKSCLYEIIRIKKYLKTVFLKNEFLTELNKQRIKHFQAELRKICDFVQSLSKFDENFRKLRFMQIKDSLEEIASFLGEPFSYFPDLNLFLISNQEPIGLCKIKSHDVIWSINPREIGNLCNRMIYTNIKVVLFDV